jgi:hypothetical protein
VRVRHTRQRKKKSKERKLVESGERPAAISWDIGLALQRQRNAPPTAPPHQLARPGERPARPVANEIVPPPQKMLVLGLDPRAHSLAKLRSQDPRRKILDRTYAMRIEES